MTNAEPKGRGLKWKGLTKTEYIDISASGAQRRRARPKGYGLTRKTERKKRAKKLNTDISAAARAKSEAVGRQALAERAASEAKFVLIAERKTQEEA